MRYSLQDGLSFVPERQPITVGGMIAAAPAEAGDPTPRRRSLRSLPDEEIIRFGDYAGADTKEMSKYLMNKGLIGAEQLVNDTQDISSRRGMLGSQSVWKPTLVKELLTKARAAGLRTPTEIAANREALIASLDPKYKEAVRNPAFSQIHPNFWQVFDSILKDQYDAEDRRYSPELAAK